MRMILTCFMTAILAVCVVPRSVYGASKIDPDKVIDNGQIGETVEPMSAYRYQAWHTATYLLDGVVYIAKVDLNYASNSMNTMVGYYDGADYWLVTQGPLSFEIYDRNDNYLYDYPADYEKYTQAWVYGSFTGYGSTWMRGYFRFKVDGFFACKDINSVNSSMGQAISFLNLDDYPEPTPEPTPDLTPPPIIGGGSVYEPDMSWTLNPSDSVDYLREYEPAEKILARLYNLAVMFFIYDVMKLVFDVIRSRLRWNERKWGKWKH